MALLNINFSTILIILLTSSRNLKYNWRYNHFNRLLVRAEALGSFLSTSPEVLKSNYYQHYNLNPYQNACR